MAKSEPYSFIIYGQPATKKNSSTIVSGHAKLIPSKPFREYAQMFKTQMMRLPQPLPHFETGVMVTAKYWLKNRAHYPDLVGLMQATADIMADDTKVIYGKRQLIKRWLLSDDRIIKRWDGTKIAGIDPVSPRVEITITPLDIAPDQETDPYIVKKLKEQSEQSLFQGAEV